MGASADQVQAAFQQTDRVIDESMARRVANVVSAYGSLENAALGMQNDDAMDLFCALLTYRAALLEIQTPTLRIARYRREANAHRARALVDSEHAAEYHGKAQHRTNNGEHDTADRFYGMARAATACMVKGADAASALDAKADRMEADITRRRAFADHAVAMVGGRS